jgi:hypothetical protein
MAFVYAKGSHEPVSVKYASTSDNSSGLDRKINVDFFADFSTVNLCPLILRYAVKYKSDVVYEFSGFILIYMFDYTYGVFYKI